MRIQKSHAIVITVLAVVSCTPQQASLEEVIRDRLARSVRQYEEMARSLADRPGELPRTIDAEGKLLTASPADWVSGFLPGTLWYLYQYTGREDLLTATRNYTQRLEQEKYNRGTHDLGFMLYCSYGNGLRLTGDTAFRSVLLAGAESLASRYNSVTGCIRSWDHNRDQWQFPVIVDNMMNLEYLFWASQASGDPNCLDICLSHADKTLANHFRPDGSRSLSGVTAYIVPNRTFRASRKYREYSKNTPVGRMTGRTDWHIDMMAMQDRSQGSAVCKNCIHMF